MELLRSATMHDSTLSYLIAAVATYPVQIDVVPQLIENREGLSPIILTSTQNEFDMAQKRGGHVIDMLATELVYLDAGELCANGPGPATKLLETVSHALACDTFLNALCKVVGLWHGETPFASAAGLLRAIVGGLDKLGSQKARNFVFALLSPFVPAALHGCLSAIEREDRVSRPLSYPFAFTIRKERIPTELSAGDFRLLLAGKLVVPPAVAPTQDESTRGLKRGREDCQQGEDSAVIDTPSSTDSGGGRAPGDGLSEGSRDGVTDEDGKDESHPPQKKRKVEGSISSIPIPPIPATALQVDGTSAQHASRGGPESKSEAQVVRGSLSDISKACSLRHVSSKSKFFSSDHGPLTFGDKVDAFVGGSTFRYVLFAGLDDAAPPGSLNATQATMAHRTLFSAQLTKRVASALGFPAAPKEHDPFMCALGRATYNRSIQEIRDAILEIYDPIIRLVLKAVAPLHSSSDDTRSLDSRRQHLRDLLELSSQGYEFHSCLSPFEAVLTTGDHVVAAMLTEDLLMDLGIIRPVVSTEELLPVLEEESLAVFA